MQDALAQEGDEGAQEELARRIGEYRDELAGFADTVENEAALDADAWNQMTFRLAEMRVELDRVIWEARLAALISGI